MEHLKHILDQLTQDGSLFNTPGDGTLRCTACAHRCLIRPGQRGICQVRFNKDGRLQVPWGYVAALQVDPVEKKPFAHLLPGSDALTFGMLGCDFHCEFCQNWFSSQALRDPEAGGAGGQIHRITAEQVAQLGKRMGAKLVVSSYNEPLITSEWAAAIFGEAQKLGMKCAFVSNAHATPEVIEFLRPYLTAYKVDLKTMQESHYREMGGNLKHVLDTIRIAHDAGLWVEVVTLVIPGFNDDPGELWDAARAIRAVSADIPWHVTAFHPDYKMMDRSSTKAESLQQAADVGQEAGLRYVYAGNLPGRVGSLENTYCPACQHPLIRRRGYTILDYQIGRGGTCPGCGEKIAGVWSDSPESVKKDGAGVPRWIA